MDLMEQTRRNATKQLSESIERQERNEAAQREHRAAQARKRIEWCRDARRPSGKSQTFSTLHVRLGAATGWRAQRFTPATPATRWPKAIDYNHP
jgi:hypothetical protein